MTRVSDLELAAVVNQRRETIWSALRDGLGVEDIRVRHGIPEEFSREVIRRWRASGALHAIVRGQA